MQWFAKKETRDKCLISLLNHIGIETGNRKESESISGIEIGIDKIQTIPNRGTPRFGTLTQHSRSFHQRMKDTIVTKTLFRLFVGVLI